MSRDGHITHWHTGVAEMRPREMPSPVCLRRYDWTAVFRFLGELDWANWLIPASCVFKEGMAGLLLLRGLIPLAIVAALPILRIIVWFVQQQHWQRRSSRPPDTDEDGVAEARSESPREALGTALLSSMPFSLVLTFCFTPSVSATIFRTWHCLPFVYDNMEIHSYLAEDLSIRCDGSQEHRDILAIAWFLIGLWPVGMCITYAALLIPCRFALLDNAPASPLVSATAFLHRDYKAA